MNKFFYIGTQIDNVLLIITVVRRDGTNFKVWLSIYYITVTVSSRTNVELYIMSHTNSNNIITVNTNQAFYYNIM